MLTVSVTISFLNYGDAVSLEINPVLIPFALQTMTLVFKSKLLLLCGILLMDL